MIPRPGPHGLPGLGLRGIRVPSRLPIPRGQEGGLEPPQHKSWQPGAEAVPGRGREDDAPRELRGRGADLRLPGGWDIHQRRLARTAAAGAINSALLASSVKDALRLGCLLLFIVPARQRGGWSLSVAPARPPPWCSAPFSSRPIKGPRPGREGAAGCGPPGLSPNHLWRTVPAVPREWAGEPLARGLVLAFGCDRGPCPSPPECAALLPSGRWRPGSAGRWPECVRGRTQRALRPAIHCHVLG